MRAVPESNSEKLLDLIQSNFPNHTVEEFLPEDSKFVWLSDNEKKIFGLTYSKIGDCLYVYSLFRVCDPTGQPLKSPFLFIEHFAALINCDKISYCCERAGMLTQGLKLGYKIKNICLEKTI